MQAYYHSTDAVLEDNCLFDSSNQKNENGKALERSEMSQSKVDYMAMEYCEHGDMFDVVKKSGKLSQGLAVHIFKQVLSAIEFLHETVGVAHLDIKLENLLIDSEFKIKMCDFGFSDPIDRRNYKNKGTDGYKAPEIYNYVQNNGYDGDKADYFSLGVLLFTMIFGMPPFKVACKEDPFYRYIARGGNFSRFFFRAHPATKELY